MDPTTELLRYVYRRFYRRLFRDLISDLERELTGMKSVLDLGCGSSSPLRYLSGSFYSLGVDLFEPSLSRSKQDRIHTDCLLMDVMEAESHFRPRSFDCVLALDLIEHLERHEALRLIGAMEGIARKKTIICTPNGFHPQDQYGGNELQIHRSGWTVEDLRELGYRTTGLNGWKPLRGTQARLRFRPKLVWLPLADITQLYVKGRPEKAYQILGVKTL